MVYTHSDQIVFAISDQLESKLWLIRNSKITKCKLYSACTEMRGVIYQLEFCFTDGCDPPWMQYEKHIFVSLYMRRNSYLCQVQAAWRSLPPLLLIFLQSYTSLNSIIKSIIYKNYFLLHICIRSKDRWYTCIVILRHVKNRLLQNRQLVRQSFLQVIRVAY